MESTQLSGSRSQTLVDLGMFPFVSLVQIALTPQLLHFQKIIGLVSFDLYNNSHSLLHNTLTRHHLPAFALHSNSSYTKDFYSNGEFEQTTTGAENVFIQDGALHIKPTLQDPSLLTKDQNLTLTDCTGTTWMACNAVTNTTNGTIIPPVKSGRINTSKGATIKVRPPLFSLSLILHPTKHLPNSMAVSR